MLLHSYITGIHPNLVVLSMRSINVVISGIGKITLPKDQLKSPIAKLLKRTTIFLHEESNLKITNKEAKMRKADRRIVALGNKIFEK